MMGKVIIYGEAVGDGWVLDRATPDRFAAITAEGRDVRAISERKADEVLPSNDLLMRNDAIRSGWVQCSGADTWVPPGGRLPMPNPDTAPVDVAFDLDHIRYGAIAFDLVIGDRRIALHFDDVEDRTLVDFVRFARDVGAGGEPHAYLTRATLSYASVRSVGNSGLVRFFFRELLDASPSGSVDVLVNRWALAAGLHRLCREIAEDPAFPLMWVSFFGLAGDPQHEAIYEAVSEEAENAWKRLVAEGRVVDQWDAQQAFEAAWEVKHIPLPATYARKADADRRMLTTLCVPKDRTA